MNIEILKNLRDNPSNNLFHNEPISLDEISELEQTYNDGNPFPKALRELLFLAGSYCTVFDFGLNETQAEMQEDARSWVIDMNLSIARPFFVIDVYNGGDQFLYVYLDEGGDDPFVYDAFLTPLYWRPFFEKKIGHFRSLATIDLTW